MSQLRHNQQVSKMEFVMIFDVPLEDRALARKVQRDLHKSGARMLQQSVWKSDSLQDLISIASLVKKAGGDARVLKEQFVF